MNDPVCPDCSEGKDKCFCDNGIKIPRNDLVQALDGFKAAIMSEVEPVMQPIVNWLTEKLNKIKR